MNYFFANSLILLFVVSNYFISCRSKQPQAQMTEFELADQFEEQTQVDDAGDLVASSQKNEQQLVMSHPKESNAWFTRKLIMTSTQPSATRIAECKERVDSAVKDAPNLRALDEVVTLLKGTVSKSQNLYHWCFYQMMSDLDSKLELETSLMSDKAEIFLRRMRTLFALGKTLDQTSTNPIYLKYLRTRYTEINQNVFGRNLETMDPDAFKLQKPA
jgi:hypothetical protein